MERVRTLLEGGTSTRRALRNKKGLSTEDDTFCSGSMLDPTEVALQARLYYEKENGRKDKRPTKVLSHKDYPSLGRYYLLLWHDVGYADQDIEEWKPADFALKFDGLVQDYLKGNSPHP